MAGTLNLTLAYGQSNAEAGGLSRVRRRDRLAFPDEPSLPHALMFNTGLIGTQARLLDRSELQDFVVAKENADQGDSGGVAFMKYRLATEPSDENFFYAYRTTGRPGRRIAELGSKTVPFQNLRSTLIRAKDIASARNLNLNVPVILFDQGEADRKYLTDPQKYEEALTRLAHDLSDVVMEVTGQLNRAWMVVTILPHASSLATARRPDISQTQVNMLDAGLNIASACCPYGFRGETGFLPGHSVHWTPKAKVLLREYGAKASRIVEQALAHDPEVRLGDMIRRQVYVNDESSVGRWEEQEVPFETSPRTLLSSIVRQGDTITGEVIYAEGGLQISPDPDYVAEHSGFFWRGPGRIRSVSVQNTNGKSFWSVKLSQAAPGRLSYGLRSQKNAPESGPAAWGDIYDCCQEPSVSIIGRVLMQGMLPFRAKLS